MPSPCRLHRVRNRFLLPGQSQTVVTRTPQISRAELAQLSKQLAASFDRFQADLKKRRLKKLRQQVVRTVPSPSADDEDPNASPDPNKASDADMQEAARSGVYARVIPELDGGRVFVNGLPLEIKRKLAARMGLVEAYTRG